MPKLPKDLFELIRAYNRYSRRRFPVAAALINLVLLCAVTFGAVFLLTLELTANPLFAIAVAAPTAAFLLCRSIASTKKYFAAKLQPVMEDYMHRLAVERLYGLSMEEYTALCLATIRERHPSLQLTNDGLFYADGGTAVVLLTSPLKREGSPDKAMMALNAGYKKLIAVCTAESLAYIRGLLEDKAADILTAEEIAHSSSALAYAELPKKQRITFRRICTVKTSNQFLKYALFSALLMALFPRMFFYFGGLAMIFSSVGLFVRIMSTVYVRPKSNCCPFLPRFKSDL